MVFLFFFINLSWGVFVFDVYITHEPFLKIFNEFLQLPGIFVALALRFDVSRGKESQYFKSAFLGYAVGLILTIVVMNWFQAAQVGSLCFLMFPEQMNNSLDNKWHHFLNVSVDQNILFYFSIFLFLLHLTLLYAYQLSHFSLHFYISFHV